MWNSMSMIGWTSTMWGANSYDSIRTVPDLPRHPAALSDVQGEGE